MKTLTNNILIFFSSLFIILIFACTGEDSRQMHEALMQAKAQNENFEPFTTDSTMLRVVDYYDSHGTANEQMLAHYLLGCVYRDLGDAPRALECYYDAVSKADTTDADCDFQRLSRIYGQMAELFHAQRSPQFEKEMWLKAKKIAHKCNDTISIISCFEQLAQTFYMIGQKDSSLHLANYAFSQYKKHGYISHAVNILPIQISIYLERKDYKTAKSLFDKFEKHYLKNGHIIVNNKLYYYYKGLYYWGIEKFDSAKFCYNKLLNSGHLISDMEAASKGLMEVYHKLGEPDSVMKYAQLFANANDSVCLISSAEEINRANALYNYNASRRQAELKKQEAEQYRNAVILICLIVAISAIAILTYIVKQKKRIKQVEATYEKTLNRYRKTACDLQLLKKDMNKYMEAKESELNELRMSLSILNSDKSPTDKWDYSRTLLESPIILHLKELAAKGKKMSDIELKDFIETMEKHTPVFYERLTNNTPELTQQEIHVCLLSKMGYSSSMIGALLALTKQRVTNIRGHANQKLFGESGAGSLNKNMQSL